MDADIKVETKYGFGTELVGAEVVGEFRYESPGMGLYAPSYYVEYLFVVAFCIDLFPIGCYRVRKDYKGRIQIVGKEKAKASEILILYIKNLMMLPIRLCLWPVVVVQDLFSE